MRRYNILQPFLLAFYSKALYQDVRQNWLGLVFSYLLLLTAFCSLLSTFHLYNYLTTDVYRAMRPWLAQVPEITVVNGNITINKPLPYYIKDPNSNQIFAIFDSSSNIATFKNSSARVFVTDKAVFLKKQNGDIKSLDAFVKKEGAFDLVEKGSHALKTTITILVCLAYPVILLLYFILGLLEAIVYAALARLFIKTTLSYDVLFRLAMVAITPKFILAAILGLFSIAIPYKWILYFALGMGYLFFAIEANKQSRELA